MRKFSILSISVYVLLLINGWLYGASAGSEWIYTGVSPSGAGSGFTSSAGLSYAGDFVYNPANPAFSHRFRLFGQWGINADHYIGNIGLSVPSSYGVVTGAFQSMNISPGINSVMGFKCGFSRLITDDFALGINAYFLNQTGAEDGSIGVGIDIGAIYQLKDWVSQKSDWGLRDNRIGLALLGLGVPAKPDADTSIPGLGVRLGISTLAMDFDDFKMKLSADFSAQAIPVNYFMNLGVKFTIASMLNLSAGYVLGNNGIGTDDYGMKHYTLGASFAYQFGETPVEIFYSYSPFQFESADGETEIRENAFHFVGTEIAFGKLDDDAPVCSLTFKDTDNTTTYLSPNYDGAMDKVTIEMEIEDTSFIEEWKLVILKSNGDTARTFEGKADREVALTIGEFFGKMIEAKTGIDIPASKEWNGTTDFGYIISEGNYRVFLTATDDMGNTGYSATNIIIVDTTPPVVSLSLDYELFSPNGDGKKDFITINQTLTGGDSWQGEIRNVEGKLMADWEWDKNPPSEIIWDGTKYGGLVADDGSYDYIIYGEDEAGNKTIMSIEGINLTTGEKSVFINLDKSAISPNDDGINDSVIITPTLSESEGVDSWLLKVADINENLIYSISGDSVPANIIWDGKNISGESVPDGEYDCELSIIYGSGDTPYTEKHPVTVDTTPPMIFFGYEPEIFSPDGDGINDLMTFELNADDAQGIDEWRLVIYNEQDRAFKIFEGEGTPSEEFTWDGYSDTGELVSSAEDYEVKFYISDELGNNLTNQSLGIIPVDVLVEEAAQGYKIRVNNIEFHSGESILTGMSYAILDRVAEILTRYSGYSVEIHGYTDNSLEETDSVELSQDRADAVLSYLSHEGISKSRMTAIGNGDTMPIADNDTEEGRRKNRRVEFILIKD